MNVLIFRVGTSHQPVKKKEYEKINNNNNSNNNNNNICNIHFQIKSIYFQVKVQLRNRYFDFYKSVIILFRTKDDIAFLFKVVSQTTIILYKVQVRQVRA